MIIAIPVWNSRISPLFDTASKAVLISLEGDNVVSRDFVAVQARERRETAPDSDLFRRAAWIASNGVNVLICGAISRPLADLITSSGTRLISRMAGDVEEILQAFIRGELPSTRFLMPGCCAGSGQFQREGRRCRRNRGPSGPAG